MVFGLQIRRRFKLNHLRESECIKITPFDRVNIKIINYILEDASRQSNQGQESRNNQYFNHRISAPLWNHLLLHSRNPSSNRSKTHRYTQSQIHSISNTPKTSRQNQSRIHLSPQPRTNNEIPNPPYLRHRHPSRGSTIPLSVPSKAETMRG